MSVEHLLGSAFESFRMVPRKTVAMPKSHQSMFVMAVSTESPSAFAAPLESISDFGRDAFAQLMENN